MSLRFTLLVSSVLSVLGIAPASADQGGLFWSYVSATGSDQNACQAPAPCATFNYAASRTVTGGTIMCLDAISNYGNVTLTSSVTIKCPLGHINGGITINLPSSDTVQSVFIEGLYSEGYGGYPALVSITSASSVVLQDMIISGASKGVVDSRTSPGKLLIKNTTINKNSGPGVVVAGAAGNTAVLDNVVLNNNTYGIAVAAGNHGSINRSTISANSVAGVEADGGALLLVNSSTIINNNVGVQSGSAIRLSNSNIQFNTTGVSGATGTYGNNRFAGNGSDGTALTPVGGSSTDLAQK